ncbi:Nudix hydrolase 2 [Senna tora]|uniref:Nudix hydrolase 2 n=1 Tax=Senna tora TaxID=362788 RepID=A0A834WW98_9FABA|nr:Nudix hydrolase 2 [Senna tora]
MYLSHAMNLLEGGAYNVYVNVVWIPEDPEPPCESHCIDFEVALVAKARDNHVVVLLLLVGRWVGGGDVRGYGGRWGNLTQIEVTISWQNREGEKLGPIALPIWVDYCGKSFEPVEFLEPAFKVLEVKALPYGLVGVSEGHSRNLVYGRWGIVPLRWDRRGVFVDLGMVPYEDGSTRKGNVDLLRRNQALNDQSLESESRAKKMRLIAVGEYHDEGNGRKKFKEGPVQISKSQSRDSMEISLCLQAGHPYKYLKLKVLCSPLTHLVPSLPKRTLLGSVFPSCLVSPQDNKSSTLFPRPYMSASTATLAKEQMGYRGISLLSAIEDRHGGVIVNMVEPMDSWVFASALKASISNWRQQGKKGVWIKLPIGHANLVEVAVKAGFRYHHAEPDYLMLVHWIPNTVDTLPPNASHRVGIGAFVMNTNREVLVVQESNGRFSGTGLWKLPTGTVDEGEDICTAAIREVKEETGVDTEFVEVLAFRQSHKSFFQKSDFFFVCMLQPHSFDIQTQASEIEAAQWMPVEDYAAQPFVRKNELFNYITKICLEKLDGNYSGFCPLLTTSSGKKTYLYFNNQDAGHLKASKDY